MDLTKTSIPHLAFDTLYLNLVKGSALSNKQQHCLCPLLDLQISFPFCIYSLNLTFFPLLFYLDFRYFGSEVKRGGGGGGGRERERERERENSLC